MDYAEITENVTTRFISPLHEVRDAAKLAHLIDSLRAGGWRGRPLLVVADGCGGYVAMTGSHRYAAAMTANLETVPCVVVQPGQGLDADCGDVYCERTGRLCDDDERLTACRELGLDVAVALIEAEIDANN